MEQETETGGSSTEVAIVTAAAPQVVSVAATAPPGGGADAGTAHPDSSKSGGQQPAGDEDDEDDADVPVDSHGDKWKKDRVAVLFGYVGSGYQGLQKNPGAKTVEDVLELALHRARGISKRNFGDLHKVGWNRAARTDKGVHAAGQVISLRLLGPRDAGPASLIDDVNAHLPPDVRVFDIVRTTGAFNSKNQCSGRQYEYLLPTFVLAPRPAQWPMTRAAPVPEATKKRLREAAAAEAAAAAGGEQLAVTLLGFSNGAADAAAAAQVRAAVAVQPWPHACPPWRPYAAPPPPPPAGDGVLGPAHARPAALVDAFTTGAADDAARRSVWAAAATAASSARTPAVAAAGADAPFRVDAATFDRLAAFVARYRGTHAFHNFTPRLTFGDASTLRYVTDARVSRPFVIGATEYVRITVIGQSFLLNQIRHMVGLAADYARGAAPADILETAFSAALVKLPLAPAEGLYLDSCAFTHYDATFGQAHGGGLTYPRPAAAAARQAFKEARIWAHVAETVEAARPFHAYAAAQAADPISYAAHVPAQLQAVIDAAAARNAKRRRGGGGGDAGGGGGGDDDGGFSAAGLMDASRPAVPASLLEGVAVSKVAREAAEFRKRVRAEKRQREEDGGGPKDYGWGDDDGGSGGDAGGGDEEGAPSGGHRGRGKRRGRGGGGRGGGGRGGGRGWRGGRGRPGPRAPR